MPRELTPEELRIQQGQQPSPMLAGVKPINMPMDSIETLPLPDGRVVIKMGNPIAACTLALTIQQLGDLIGYLENTRASYIGNSQIIVPGPGQAPS